MHKSVTVTVRRITAEAYVGWRRWSHWELGVGGWLLDGADGWLNLGWLYCGVNIWRDK